MSELSIVTLGHVHAEDLAALTPHFSRLEQLVLETDTGAARNRAIDAASNDWILIVREREVVPDALAREIVHSIAAGNAWGFRIAVVPFYAGRPLRLGPREGELRLFHRRHYLKHQDAVQGTVVRLRAAFEALTFESAEAHRAYLEKTGVPHSGLRRTLLFLRDVVATRAHDTNTLRYIWTEAGFDKSSRA